MTAVPAHLRKAAAKDLGLNEQYVYQCLTGRVRTPIERCPAFERAFAGLVTAEQLRPDVCWHRVADPAWPHPAGRPLIDVAAPAAQEPAHG